MKAWPLSYLLPARDPLLPPQQPQPQGLTKRYSLDVMEADILHASMDKDACATAAVAEAGELNK
jgi:hypothetical protein